MSPRSEQTNRELRRSSQERILTAALEVFAEQGYENATISQITERAGVSRGLVSYYFATKQDLLRAILGRWLDGLLTMLDDLAPDGPPNDLLATVIDRALLGASTQLGTQRLVLCLMLQPGTRGVYAQVERDRAEAMRAFEDRLRDIFAARGAADPAVEEALLRSLLEGVLFKLAVYEQGYPLDAIRSRLFALYGLGEPAPLPLPADVFAESGRLRAPLG
ncbi:TetR/AcrR family transcriptional regulator [Plantactinospora sp. KLBMP9567]|uniref:TetR/AcrR family transcriptional regulator n=1 Tax=Plantactinospora sp. KLBMP9567 TaxID=3085900 RepID=UPI0029819DEA|nr:TetR/AcrR family transcriptional regulator [Plantactinospora sp. KLBMP9567]MDW5328344.1 TetR/AcrR family transcriptional regulator [Plantactinospora sp. KLBMP9567]